MPTYLSPGVYVEEVDSGSRPIEGVGTAVAAFVGFAEKGPLQEPRLITNWTQFTSLYGDVVAGFHLAHAVFGYFLNGGGSCYVVRIDADGGGDGQAQQDLPASSATLGSYRITARPAGDGSSAKDISVEVTDPPAESPEGTFTVKVRRGNRVEETYDAVSTTRGEHNVVTAVADRSKLITLEETGTTGATTMPHETVTLRPDAPAVPAPTTVSADDYVGDVERRRGVKGLEAVDEITMLAAPDLMSAYQQGRIDLDGVKNVQLAMIAHCELMGDRVAVLDPPPDLSPQDVLTWRRDTAGYDSKFAALYYPWVKVPDRATRSDIFIPPSGHVAGVWARSDESRGVHKAPANEVLRGVSTLQMQVTTKEQEHLNPAGVNCLRAFPGRGLRVWGARTMSSDPAWRYLNVRRLFNYLEESILEGTQWVVFEPNDDALWARLRRTIGAFLTNEWRKGSLFGLTPDEAFYVKCDRETNPPEVIDAGQVVCEVGVAPVKPAEFVIFRLAQFSGGASAVEA